MMKFLTGVSIMIMFALMNSARADCSWEESYVPRNYYLRCGEGEVSIPALPENALSAVFEHFNGEIPQSLFVGRNLDKV